MVFTHLDLLLDTSFLHKEWVSKSKFIEKYHENVKDHIKKLTQKYDKYNNKGGNKLTLEEGD